MKKVLMLMLIVIVFVCTGCEEQTNVGVLTCTNTNTDENGFNTHFINIVEHSNGKIVAVTTMFTQETPIANEAYVYYQEAFNEVNNINGVFAQVNKTSDTSVTVISKIDYKKVNMEELTAGFGQWEVSDPDDDDEIDPITKETTLEEYKEDHVTDEMVCFE